MSDAQTPVKAVLAWISGVVAVLSLVLGVAALNRAVSDWRDARATVNQVVAGADAAREALDFRLAKSGYDEAMGLDATSPELRDGQTELALAWIAAMLDDIRDGETPASLATPLMPSLYRGLETASTRQQATIWAHIGRGQHLQTMGRSSGRIRRDEIANVLAIYRRALRLDAKAFDAHLYRGLLHLERPADIRSAGEDFTRAADIVVDRHGRDSDEYRWVRRVALHALLRRMSDLVLWNDEPEEHAAVLLDWLSSMQAESDALPDRRYVDRILSLYRDAGQPGRDLTGLLGLLPRSRHAAVYAWLLDGEVALEWLEQEHNQVPLLRIQAALLEPTEPERAVEIYRELLTIDWLRDAARDELEARVRALDSDAVADAAPERTYVSDPIPAGAAAYDFHLDTLHGFDIYFEPPNADAAFRYFAELEFGDSEGRERQVAAVTAARQRIVDDFLALRRGIAESGYTSEHSRSAEISATRNALRAHELVTRYELREQRYDGALAEIEDARALADAWVPGWISRLRARALSGRNAAGDLDRAADELERHVDAEVRYGGALNWTEIQSHPDFAALRTAPRYAAIMRGR
ncbi:MAG: hypothetical protein AAFX10_13540 [Pseudomonadota bacterium]